MSANLLLIIVKAVITFVVAVVDVELPVDWQKSWQQYRSTTMMLMAMAMMTTAKSVAPGDSVKLETLIFCDFCSPEQFADKLVS